MRTRCIASRRLPAQPRAAISPSASKRKCRVAARGGTLRPAWSATMWMFCSRRTTRLPSSRSVDRSPAGHPI